MLRLRFRGWLRFRLRGWFRFWLRLRLRLWLGFWLRLRLRLWLWLRFRLWLRFWLRLRFRLRLRLWLRRRRGRGIRFNRVRRIRIRARKILRDDNTVKPIHVAPFDPDANLGEIRIKNIRAVPWAVHQPLMKLRHIICNSLSAAL